MKYTGQPFTVARSADQIAERMSDLTVLRSMIDCIPESERQKIGNIDFTPDSIKINTQQVGDVAFKLVERTPQRLAFAAQGSPMPMKLIVDMAPTSTPAATEATCAIDVDIPVFMRPLVAPHLNKALDMLSTVLKSAL